MKMITGVTLILLFLSAGLVAALRAEQPRSSEGFSIPKGDVADGRNAFIKLNCIACHAVQGDRFPRAPWSANQGPMLRDAKDKKGPGYLLDSIVSPSHRISGDEITGFEELSHMGDYTHAMSVRELLDIVAYLNADN